MTIDNKDAGIFDSFAEMVFTMFQFLAYFRTAV